MVINTFLLTDQSNATLSNAIVEEVLCCFKDEALPAPWDKEIKKVVGQNF
jgi:hypothetical protein